MKNISATVREELSFVLKKMKKPWDFCISSRRGKIRLSLRLWAY